VTAHAVLPAEVTVGGLTTSVYTVPTDGPESDDTFAWDSTTLVLVEAEAGGVTGLGWTYGAAAVSRLVDDLAAAALAEAYELDLSSHGSPAVSMHALCALPRLRHLEWFHDHVRIERMLSAGAPVPVGGAVQPDPSRPGLGLELKASDAARWAA
jgi:hypothetical protein